MNRAQEIRQRRLKERETETKKEMQHDEEVQKEVEKLYEWVLDMLDKPSEFNTPDEVYLSDSYRNKIRIGNSFEKGGLTERPFNDETMKQLADKFQREEGYTGQYFSGTFPESYSCVTIRIV